MTAAHKYLDRAWLKSLSGSELLLLMVRYGKSVASAVEAELNRRSFAAYGDLALVPVVVTGPSDRRRASNAA